MTSEEPNKEEFIRRREKIIRVITPHYGSELYKYGGGLRKIEIEREEISPNVWQKVPNSAERDLGPATKEDIELYNRQP